MTTIAELFVALGVKGSDKTVGALGGVKKGLEEVKSTSLETKAAIVGAMYALERMFAVSGQRGTDLTNFTSLVGMSAKSLQQYQYAARQVGVSNDEMAGTFKSLQSTMTKTLMGEGAPKGLARVAQLTGNISPADLKRFAEQPQLLIQKLQEYAQKESNTGLRNEVLKSFGVGENMISAFNRNAFRPEVLGKAPTYNDSEVKSLDKANIAWSNLGNKIEMAFGHFNAKHGQQLTGDISKIVDQVVKLAEAFERLATKLKLFEYFGKIFEGWAIIFNGISSAVTGLTDATDATDATEDPKKQQTLKEGVGDLFKELPGVFKAFADDVGLSDKVNSGAKVVDNVKTSAVDFAKGFDSPESGKPAPSPSLRLVVPPPASPAAPSSRTITPNPGAAAAGTANHLNVNQTLNFQHPGTESKATADSAKKGIQDAYRQITAIGNGG